MTTGQFDHRQASKRRFRLYCLECGDASYTEPPWKWYTDHHVKLHNIKVDDFISRFLVLDRGEDTSVDLAQNLATMITSEKYVVEDVPIGNDNADKIVAALEAMR